MPPQWRRMWVGPWQQKVGWLGQRSGEVLTASSRDLCWVSCLRGFLSSSLETKGLHCNSAYSLVSSIGEDQKKDFSRPSATGEAFWSRAPPQTRELCSPKRGLCPKKSNKLGATGVQFKAWDSQNTGCHSRIREQELFFRRFCNKAPFFCGSTPEIVEICAFFEMKTFFYFIFGFHPKIRGNSRWKPLFFGPHFYIWSIELLCPPQNLFVPHQSRYPGAGPGLHQNSIVFFEVSVSGLGLGLSELGPTLPKQESRPSLPRWQHWLHELLLQMYSTWLSTSIEIDFMFQNLTGTTI